MKGILDPSGKNMNPLTGEPYSDQYKELSKVWSKFPAYENAKDIIDDIKNNQIILIVSGTGSGKTVLMPKYVLHVFDYDKKIAVTLPKQIIAKSAAEFSAKTLDVKLGDEVGFQYKGESKKSSKTKLLYATDGTIVARLLRDPLLEEFNCVIIDEAHERKVQIDFLLFLLKNTISKRKDFKVIIMSATINAQIFKDYFKGHAFKQIDIGSKSHYEVKSIFLDKDIDKNSYLSHGVKIINDIVNSNKVGDILFFITSKNEAYSVCKKLDTKMGYCVEVYSGVNATRQEIAQHKDMYKEQGNYTNKIVAATNVAESSLTIDGIKYVIDSGVELRSYYDPILRARCLDKEYITLAQAKQRLGRTGRTEPGLCYHLYSKDTFDNMIDYPQPDIRTSNISAECLRLLNLETIKDTNGLLITLNKFIEPPTSKYFKDAIFTLTELNLINDEITELGRLAATLNSDPEISVCYILSVFYECSYEIGRIFSMIDASKTNMDSLFISERDLIGRNNSLKSLKNKIKQKLFDAKNKFYHQSGDHLSLMKIYDKYRDMRKNGDENKTKDWIVKHFLKKNILDKATKSNRSILQNLRNLKEKKEIIDNIVSDLGLAKSLEEPVENRVLYCLYYAFKLNTAKKIRDSSKYKPSHVKKDVSLSKSSYIYNKNYKNILYHELFSSMGRFDLNIVSKIPQKFI